MLPEAAAHVTQTRRQTELSKLALYGRDSSPIPNRPNNIKVPARPKPTQKNLKLNPARDLDCSFISGWTPQSGCWGEVPTEPLPCYRPKNSGESEGPDYPNGPLRHFLDLRGPERMGSTTIIKVLGNHGN